jgi:hydroxypyruvate reductase
MLGDSNKMKTLTKMRTDAQLLFSAGLRAVDPENAVKKYCRIDGNRLRVGSGEFELDSFEKIHVIGCGKATAPMAQAIETLLEDRITNGVLNVKYGHLAHLERISIIEAGHPVPDQNGEEGARRIMELAMSSGPNDLVLCLISGGGSALLPLPAPQLILADKQETIRVLIACGATIHEINAIRKHTSAIKGGRLAQAVYPASLVTLILSDVVGDDLDVIASGPCVPDSSTFQDCIGILNKYDIRSNLPDAIVRHLQAGAAGKISETPKHDDPAFSRGTQLVIGSNSDAIKAAGTEASRRGYCPLILSSMFEGDTDEVSRVHGAIVREVLKSGNPVLPPACILSGGETTVVLHGTGRGGRNQQFALTLAPLIAGQRSVVALSAGTDGTDGPTDAAGAIIDNTTITKAEAIGLDYRNYLDNNDAYNFFSRTGELLITGPTKTNVMDLRVLLIA